MPFIQMQSYEQFYRCLFQLLPTRYNEDSWGLWSQVSKYQRRCYRRNFAMTDLSFLWDIYSEFQRLHALTRLALDSGILIASNVVWEDYWKRNVAITSDNSKRHDIDFKFYDTPYMQSLCTFPILAPKHLAASAANANLIVVACSNFWQRELHHRTVFFLTERSPTPQTLLCS